jgi:formiminoglutamase
LDRYEYRQTKPTSWTGRIDDDDDREAFRWHQVVECIDLDAPFPQIDAAGPTFVILGFCCDEGVRLNKGRRGAARAPASIRRELANLPVGFSASVRMLDGGDIRPRGDDLAGAQQGLAEYVGRIVDGGAIPLVFGGGHETALGHENGLRSSMERAGADPGGLGVVNFDAHLDMRPEPRDGSSGTMFRQIAEQRRAAGLAFPYCCVGVQHTGNTRRLLKTAEEQGTVCLFAKEIAAGGLDDAEQQLKRFTAGLDAVYLTVCADVFSAAFAPGVSATQPFGMDPETVLILMRSVIATGKVRGFDIAEVSPRFDDDNQTAKLAAVIVYAVVADLIDGAGS